MNDKVTQPSQGLNNETVAQIMAEVRADEASRGPVSGDFLTNLKNSIAQNADTTFAETVAKIETAVSSNEINGEEVKKLAEELLEGLEGGIKFIGSGDAEELDKLGESLKSARADFASLDLTNDGRLTEIAKTLAPLQAAGSKMDTGQMPKTMAALDKLSGRIETGITARATHLVENTLETSLLKGDEPENLKNLVVMQNNLEELAQIAKITPDEKLPEAVKQAIAEGSVKINEYMASDNPDKSPMGFMVENHQLLAKFASAGEGAAFGGEGQEKISELIAQIEPKIKEGVMGNIVERVISLVMDVVSGKKDLGEFVNAFKKDVLEPNAGGLKELLAGNVAENFGKLVSGGDKFDPRQYSPDATGKVAGAREVGG